ncbi:MAG: quinol:electron acceptor oxidoreductase subunit ActD [Aureliella sp.]
MAEYADDNQLLDAARKVKDSGYTRIDAFTPFAVHGIDEALGIKPTILPWFTLCAGFTGLTVALTMEYWMNAVNYPYIISGKPYASWPAFIPVAFELTVLFSAFTTVFAMLGLNGLPRFSSPMFSNPKFDRTTDDRFFLWIDSSDKYFNSEKVQSLLSSTGALSVEEVREDDSSTEIPKQIIFAIVALILVTLIPGSIVLNMRNAKSGESRLHVFFDMDFQPSRHTQSPTKMFPDGRVQRPPVSGTVARGELGADDTYILGYDPNQTVGTVSASAAAKLVSFQQEGDTAEHAAQPATDEAAPAAATGVPNYAWLTELPVEANDKLFELGRHKFEQNCAVCHGFGGYGNGLVAQRAAELAQGYWLQPANLHDKAIEEQPVGRLYYTITHGKGKMGSYAASLTPQERWAVVAYVKALQRSQNAQPSDVPTPADIAQ